MAKLKGISKKTRFEVFKRPNSEDLSFRYFCGICWAIVREESL